MTDAAERLYTLLPAIYRTRDAEYGQPLRAFMALIEEELRAIETDIDGLYDDAFIETCAEWVVPYIGDLLAVRGLHDIGGASSQRAYVANTLAYRRRKGTAAVLEQLARDVTGWPAHAVEFFERLITTQHLNHVRSHCLAAPNLRPADQHELINGPFERAMHTAELRHIASGRGRYNIMHIGLFLWRLQSYPLILADARPVVGPPDGRYTFSPRGDDMPLFNPGRSESDIVSLASEPDVPGLLRRRPLYVELEQRRQALADDQTEQQILDQSVFFGQQPAFSVRLDVLLPDANTDIPPVSAQRIRICDLSDWRMPTPLPTTPTDTAEYQTVTVAADPVLGRLIVSPPTEARVQVSYAYGFSGDIGGGPYDRRKTLPRWNSQDRPITWQIGVTKDQRTLLNVPAPDQLVETLGAALTAWNTHVTAHPGARGLIAIMDNSNYDESFVGANAITLPEGSELAIVAADWPQVPDPSTPGAQQRVTSQFTPAALRSCLRGDIAVVGEHHNADADRGELVIDGLLIDGKLTVLSGDLGALTLVHCTLVPARGGPGSRKHSHWCQRRVACHAAAHNLRPDHSARPHSNTRDRYQHCRPRSSNRRWASDQRAQCGARTGGQYDLRNGRGAHTERQQHDLCRTGCHRTASNRLRAFLFCARWFEHAAPLPMPARPGIGSACQSPQHRPGWQLARQRARSYLGAYSATPHLAPLRTPGV